MSWPDWAMYVLLVGLLLAVLICVVWLWSIEHALARHEARLQRLEADRRWS